MKAMEGKKKQPMHDKKHHQEHVPAYLRNGSDTTVSADTAKRK